MSLVVLPMLPPLGEDADGEKKKTRRPWVERLPELWERPRGINLTFNLY